MRTVARESISRLATAGAEKPEKIGTASAPSEATAYSAATASGTIGRSSATASPWRTPRSWRPSASRAVSRASSAYVQLRVDALLALPGDGVAARVRGIVGEALDARVGQVEATAHEPPRPLGPRRLVEHLAVRLRERQREVLHDRVPEAVEIGDRRGVQLVVSTGDAEAARQPAGVRAAERVVARLPDRLVVHAVTLSSAGSASRRVPASVRRDQHRGADRRSARRRRDRGAHAGGRRLPLGSAHARRRLAARPPDRARSRGRRGGRVGGRRSRGPRARRPRRAVVERAVRKLPALRHRPAVAVRRHRSAAPCDDRRHDTPASPLGRGRVAVLRHRRLLRAHDRAGDRRDPGAARDAGRGGCADRLRRRHRCRRGAQHGAGRGRLRGRGRRLRRCRALRDHGRGALGRDADHRDRLEPGQARARARARRDARCAGRRCRAGGRRDLPGGRPGLRVRGRRRAGDARSSR